MIRVAPRRVSKLLRLRGAKSAAQPAARLVWTGSVCEDAHDEYAAAATVSRSAALSQAEADARASTEAESGDFITVLPKRLPESRRVREQQ